jgi:hypothetical protein
MKKLYKDKVNLVYTDTDSLLYEVETEDLYEDLKKPEFNQHFDFSNYCEEKNPHNLFSTERKMVNGCFKDELKGLIGLEYIGLRSKSYSILYQVTQQILQEIKKSKSVKRLVVDRFLTHRHFKKCLLKNRVVKIRQNTIRSLDHQLFTLHQRRQGLSSYDNKRYILECNVSTFAFGHYRIPQKH